MNRSLPVEVDHFSAHLVVPRRVYRPVPRTGLKALIRQCNRPLTNRAAGARHLPG